MHVLVTGGAGFIGSHLVDALLAEGHHVVVFDNFDDFYDPAVKHANIVAHRDNSRCLIVTGDIRDPASLAGMAGPQFDAIVHLAARAGVRPSIDNPLLYQDVNVRGTQNLLEFARHRKIPRFVFTSSSSVYGVSPNLPWREDANVLQPISPYASTKVSGELLGHVYSHLYGIRFVALRLFTVYGPRQRPDLAIHKFARLLLDGRPIPFFGDGTTGRDYTYISDIVAGIQSALRYNGSLYEVFNLGSDHPVRLSDLILELERATGKTAELDLQPMQPGDVLYTWADVGKASRLLGYAPATPLRDGIQCFVAWLSAQRGRVAPEAQ
jgi:UDP-glucuronate 4-epimerase